MKALATSQIILLVIGIIVLAVIGYMVYTQYVAGNTQFGQTNCQSRAVSVCTNCKTCVLGLGKPWIETGCDANLPPRECASICDVSDECAGQFGLKIPAIICSSFCKQVGVE